jgi:hypothetical protein
MDINSHVVLWMLRGGQAKLLHIVNPNGTVQQKRRDLDKALQRRADVQQSVDAKSNRRLYASAKTTRQ